MGGWGFFFYFFQDIQAELVVYMLGDCAPQVRQEQIKEYEVWHLFRNELFACFEIRGSGKGEAIDSEEFTVHIQEHAVVFNIQDERWVVGHRARSF